jgi:hypothetical protein
VPDTILPLLVGREVIRKFRQTRPVENDKDCSENVRRSWVLWFKERCLRTRNGVVGDADKTEWFCSSSERLALEAYSGGSLSQER